MEENLKRYEELAKLMEKIDESMELSKEKALKRGAQLLGMYNETKPMMVELEKEKLDEMQQEGTEFDEMTKNAMINAKKEILIIRQKSEKEYEKALVETMQKQNEIQEKLNKMRSRYSSQEENDIENLKTAESAAEKAMENVKQSMSDMQKEHFGRISKLDEYERKLGEYAISLNMGDELDKIEINNEDIEKAEVENEKQETPKTEQAQENKEPEKSSEENKEPEKSSEENKEPEKSSEEKSSKENKERKEVSQAKASVILSNIQGQKTMQGNVATNKVEQSSKVVKTNQETNKPEGSKPEQSKKENVKEENVLEPFNSIEINAKEGKLKILFQDEKMNKEVSIKEIIENKKALYSRIGLRKIVMNYCKNMNYGILKVMSLMKNINPAIIVAINQYGTQTDYEEYFDALATKYSGMPFNVKYDLRDSTMDSKAFRLMNKFAKNDMEIYGVVAEGIEKNWIEKMIDRIRNVKLLGKGKEPEQIEEPQNAQEEQRQNFLKEQEADKETKEKMEQVIEQYNEEQNSVKEMAKSTHINKNNEVPKITMDDIKNEKDENEASL